MYSGTPKSASGFIHKNERAPDGAAEKRCTLLVENAKVYGPKGLEMQLHN